MIEIAAAIYQIHKVSGRNDKEALLAKYADVPGFKDVLRFIYNPYIRTGIAAAKLKKAIPAKSIGGEFHPAEMIGYFTRNQTGSDENVSVAKGFVEQFQPGSQERWLAEGMVMKNLKIGVSDKTLNKVYGEDFIPKIGVMLAEKYEEQKEKVPGPYIVTEKLDGARRIMVKEDGNITMYSRSGIPDDGLVDIEREAAYLPDNCVFDGELLAIGEFENAVALRQASNSIANSKGVRTGVTFNVFDMVPVADFKVGKSVHTANVRKMMLSAMFKDPSIECLVPMTYKQAIEEFGIDHDFEFIKVVPLLGMAATEEDVLQLARPIWNRGFEGVMLNTVGGYYELKRSKSVLKVKHVEESTLEVIAVELGRPGTANEHRLGSLIVDYKGNNVGVGSGIENAVGGLRDKWWNNPSLIVGKYIEIEHFGESKNKQGGISLNCPIFKRVAGTIE
jgi:DNA ligase-1